LFDQSVLLENIHQDFQMENIENHIVNGQIETAQSRSR